MLVPSSTTSQLLTALVQKKHLSNHISRLVESGQACQKLITFRDLDTSGGEFVCEVTCGELVVKGKGINKREARRKAAMTMIEQVENVERVENAVKNVVQNSVENPETVQNLETVTNNVSDTKDTWSACLTLLTGEDKDWVRSLAIFAFNTATGSPKYKVMKVVKAQEGQKIYRVLCTWNMFFFEGEAVSRGKAEQEAARKMMNKVRTVCGMEEIVRTGSLAVECDSEDSHLDIDSSTHDNLTDQMMDIMGKHSSLLKDSTLGGMVEQLDMFSDKVGNSSPVYTIAGVSTSGCLVMVEVTCTWFNLTTRGKGSSKVIAEQEAAMAMIKKVQEMMKQKLEKLDSMNVTSIETSPLPSPSTDDEAVQYLVYPGHGHDLGQANVTITSRDYICLQSEQFLNDVIIDFYLKYLQTGLFSSSYLMEKTYIFSIYFYKRLTMNTKSKSPTLSQAEAMHNNVKKWTKNVNIFEKDFIVVPINDCDHWFVIIICYPALITRLEEGGRVMQPLMLVLDSLEDGQKDSVCKDLRTYLTMEWKEKMKSSRQFTAANMPSFCPKIPQQDNLTDCGLFLLEYVESFFKEPITNFSTPLVSLANWFTDEKVDSKREDIARLIRELTTKQHSAVVFPDICFSAELQQLATVEKKNMTAEDTIKVTNVPPNTSITRDSVTKSVTKSTMKINLRSKAAAKQPNIPPTITPDSYGHHAGVTPAVSVRDKRTAETQLGGGKRYKDTQEDEDGQDWWCDY